MRTPRPTYSSQATPWPRFSSTGRLGSAALDLCYVACGRYDLFVHHYLFPWDIAAGILLVQEAGGVITNHLGAPIDITSLTVIAGAPRAHADFLRWQQERARSARHRRREFSHGAPP